MCSFKIVDESIEDSIQEKKREQYCFFLFHFLLLFVSDCFTFEPRN